jgi:hypothetical protein
MGGITKDKSWVMIIGFKREHEWIFPYPQWQAFFVAVIAEISYLSCYLATLLNAHYICPSL